MSARGPVEEWERRAYAEDRVTASCTWGEGPDVLLKDSFADRDGRVVYLDLTADQALRLAASLIGAAHEALALDADFAVHLASLPA